MTMAQIALYIGAFDAGALLLMGLISAAFYLFDIEAEGFWKRVWPAVGILLSTSVAAVFILLAFTWISGILT